MSKRLRDTLVSESGIPVDQTAVVYNGVDCDHYAGEPDHTLRAELGIPDGSFLFGAVGNVRAPKAYDTLLRAASIAVKTEPSLRFAVVGEGSSPLLDELLRLRAELGLQNVVHFAGFRPDVTVPLRNFDAYVMSSRTEGFPVAVVQAMARGLPVIATRCGGPEEQLTDAVDGLLVPREDPAALSAAMIRIARDEALRHTLGSAAAVSARARFSLSAMIEGYEDIYARALGMASR